jgi:hypothetical protein
VAFWQPVLQGGRPDHGNRESVTSLALSPSDNPRGAHRPTSTSGRVRLSPMAAPARAIGTVLRKRLVPPAGG